MGVTIASARIPLAMFLLATALLKTGSRPRLERSGLTVLAIVAETACGIALVIPPTQRVASFGAVILGLAFVGYRSGLLGRLGESGDSGRGCGCLGDRLRPPDRIQVMLPWIIVAGGSLGAVTARSEYADPVLALIAVCCGWALLVWLAMALRGSTDSWAVVRADLAAWLPRDTLASLGAYRVGPRLWVSDDFVLGSRIVRIEARIRRSLFGAPRVDASATELLPLDEIEERAGDAGARLTT